MPFAAIKRLLTPRQSPSLPTKETLFPTVTKEEAEAACDHDCAACPDGGSGYGPAFDKIGVETGDLLWGQIKPYSTHVVVATGATDWIRDVEDIKGSVMEGLAKRRELVDNGRMMISASNLPLPQDGKEEEGRTSLVLLPAFVVLEDVAPDDADAIITQFVNAGPTTSTPLLAETDDGSSSGSGSGSGSGSSSSNNNNNNNTPTAAAAPPLPLPQPHPPSPPPLRSLRSHPHPHAFLILLCSHRHRDARCGISAPILRREFERHLRALNLWRDASDSRPGGASVVLVSHVGGHSYSANVLVYRAADGQGVWLARVAPRHVGAIVEHTVVRGRVVDVDMVRGGFNRRTGMTSW